MATRLLFGLAAGGSVLATGPSAVRADGVYVTGRWKTYADAALAWRGYDSECSSLGNRIQGLLTAFNEAQGALLAQFNQLESEIRSLIAEKQLGMEEFRRGLMCNKCHKTQSELGGPEAFRKHLGDVKAEPVPPTLEEIAAKEREYDDKIRVPQDRLSGLRDRSNQAEASYRTAAAERQRVCQLAGIARTAALQLKGLEQEKQQHSTKDPQRPTEPYRCEDFSQETSLRITELTERLTVLSANIQSERAGLEATKQRLPALRRELASSRDQNQSQILTQAINAEEIKATLHQQQISALDAKSSQVTSSRDNAVACAQRANQ